MLTKNQSTQIMGITLEKLDVPLRNSEQVLQRIAALLEVDLPQKKKPPMAAAQAQPIIARLTQVASPHSTIHYSFF